MERIYRKQVKARGLVSFQVMVKETDLWVSADHDLFKTTHDLVLEYRHQLETYIQAYPLFLTTLEPYPIDPFAPQMIQEMIEATRTAGVGPMAAVAGAIAQFVGRALLKDFTKQVIIENGGDIFLKVDRDTTVSISAGSSPFSGRIGIQVHKKQMPLGVCCSSGTVGHSLSFGRADAICILAASAVLADSAATALGNRIKQKADLDHIAQWAQPLKGVSGVVAIMQDKIAAWGDVELVHFR
ncbi:MAG: UPF0280 family protein [Desulfobacteraceae bacterium]|nr:MAG: UPF0280 family protein [Desulfobacteraceae bacterium]